MQELRHQVQVTFGVRTHLREFLNMQAHHALRLSRGEARETAVHNQGRASERHTSHARRLSYLRAGRLLRLLNGRAELGPCKVAGDHTAECRANEYREITRPAI